MKVAIVTHFPSHPDRFDGGVEAVSLTLSSSLACFPDLDVHIVTFDKSIKEATISPWGKITVHRLPAKTTSMIVHAVGKGRKTLQDYLARLSPDLVHAHDTYGIMVHGLKIPRVFTIHGFIHADILASNSKWKWLRSAIWRWIETSAWRDQPHIISISPYVREMVSKFSDNCIHDIDNPVSEDCFQILRNDQGRIIFSAAVISPRKNPLSLLRAFELVLKDFPDAQLRLAGSIADPLYGQKLTETIRQNNLEHSVILLGKITRAQLYQELANASLFALTSLEENSPMGIEEAMAAGLPVVTSRRCGMPYMVRDGESGYLIDPLAPDDIASRLKMLLGNDQLRASMGMVGKKIALEKYHSSQVAAKTRDVYLEVLRGRAG